VETQQHITVVAVAILYSTAVALGLFMVLGLISKRNDAKALARIAGLNCPHCSQPYGAAARDSVSAIRYSWLPAVGHSVSSLNLPRRTFLVTCSHCAAEVERTKNGSVFHHPQQGILSYSRTGPLKK
jgi:hypothetical protein